MSPGNIPELSFIKRFYSFLLLLSIFFIISCRIQAQDSKKSSVISDSVLISNTVVLKKLLEEKKTKNAMRFFYYGSIADSLKTLAQLKKIANEIEGIRSKTKSIQQITYKQYKNRFTIVTVLYYNNEGRFYLYELFYEADGLSKKVQDIFIKDPIVLSREREKHKAAKKENPNLVFPPHLNPPGIYIKESN